jgi:hypothetical protein
VLRVQAAKAAEAKDAKAEAVHRAELARLKREQEADERRWKEEQAPRHAACHAARNNSGD